VRARTALARWLRGSNGDQSSPSVRWALEGPLSPSVRGPGHPSPWASGEASASLGVSRSGVPLRRVRVSGQAERPQGYPVGALALHQRGSGSQQGVGRVSGAYARGCRAGSSSARVSALGVGPSTGRWEGVGGPCVGASGSLLECRGSVLQGVGLTHGCRGLCCRVSG